MKICWRKKIPSFHYETPFHNVEQCVWFWNSVLRIQLELKHNQEGTSGSTNSHQSSVEKSTLQADTVSIQRTLNFVKRGNRNNSMDEISTF